MRNESEAERIDAARTAAAILYVIDGVQAPVREALLGLAAEEQLEAIATPLAQDDRTRRARVLAAYMARLVADLDAWSLR